MPRVVAYFVVIIVLLSRKSSTETVWDLFVLMQNSSSPIRNPAPMIRNKYLTLRQINNRSVIYCGYLGDHLSHVNKMKYGINCLPTYVLISRLEVNCFGHRVRLVSYSKLFYITILRKVKINLWIFTSKQLLLLDCRKQIAMSTICAESDSKYHGSQNLQFWRSVANHRIHMKYIMEVWRQC